ncbi:patatin-like phospholipase family protein [Lysobacter sp. GX 14042]|uniref:patatin-like phospholipase family protein n=1 Tax=Lysobacter sp. GX 14042 TaxID=2907155 RepID=UPI001F39D252|nr:patatin-like phospholipase family protein [Lysobacter sp. GX 14042]
MHARRILSVDGGGIRGLVSCTWLEGVEAALANAGKPGLTGSFDLLAGTSTGALVTCGLGLGWSPATLATLYRERRAEIFPGTPGKLWSRARRLFRHGLSAPRYDGRGLEAVLEEVFGDRRLGELQRPTLITSYDTLARRPVIFKSFLPEHADLRLRDVCRASTAAPSYFPAHGMEVDGKPCALIDGGIVANNPTACAIAEALRRDRGVSQCGELVVLSVGTGERNQPIPLKAAQEWGAVEWAIPIIDVLFDGNADSVDYIARQLVGKGYFRLQAELLAGLDDLDETSAAHIAALESLARDYLLKPQTQQMLRQLASMI